MIMDLFKLLSLLNLFDEPCAFHRGLRNVTIIAKIGKERLNPHFLLNIVLAVVELRYRLPVDYDQ